MADVIRLQERLPRAPRKSAPVPSDAKILIFTGIRYEPIADRPTERVVLVDGGEPVKH